MLNRYKSLCLILLLVTLTSCQAQGDIVETPLTSGASTTVQEPTVTLEAVQAAKPSATPTLGIQAIVEVTPTAGVQDYIEATPDPDIIWEMIAEVDQERILADLRQLTGIDPLCTLNGCYTITNRETGSEELGWVKDYVFEQLVNLGYAVEVQDWSRYDFADQNLVARKTGSLIPEEEIYFIAHMDGYLTDNPAANDDATGVVALLEVARILSTQSLSRTVVLIFSTGEEHGSLGSHSYMEQLTPDQISAIQYVVSVEMLGYDSNNDGAMELWSGDQPTQFVELLRDIITTYQPDLAPEIVTGCT